LSTRAPRVFGGYPASARLCHTLWAPLACAVHARGLQSDVEVDPCTLVNATVTPPLLKTSWVGDFSEVGVQA